MNNNSYELKVTSSTENLSVIRKFVRSKTKDYGLSKDDVEKIILAVDEASSNIMRHAYHLRPDGEIVVRLSFSGDSCEIILTDFGTGFNPEVVPKPDMKEYFKKKRVGGLGMHLMKLLMDDVDYRSVAGEYNRLKLIKKLSN